jgi:hypothetical protein
MSLGLDLKVVSACREACFSEALGVLSNEFHVLAFVPVVLARLERLKMPSGYKPCN